MATLTPGYVTATRPSADGSPLELTLCAAHYNPPGCLACDPAPATLTRRRAYDMGARSSRTLSDWDDALARFTRKHCAHRPDTMCALERAWCDGWDDAQEGNRNRRPA